MTEPNSNGIFSRTAITQAGGVVIAIILIYFISTKIDAHEKTTFESSLKWVEKIEQNTAAQASVVKALESLENTIRLQSIQGKAQTIPIRP